MAAVLGTVAGTATGYALQAGRPPTPLPPLAQPGLAYPAKSLPEGEEAEPLSAEEDSQVRTDGDLRKLLIGRPAGGRELAVPWLDGKGWVPISSYAYYHSDDYSSFSSALEKDIRRVAGMAWEEGGDRQGNIVLVQYRPSVNAQGPAEMAVLPGHMRDRAGNSGHPVAGTAEGRSYVFESTAEAGRLPFRAYATAYRGDVLIKVNLFDSEPISEKDIRTLIERQLERL
ncbi:hypothetical protein ACIOEX_17200 [Streptomyces sp. NPDC087850]|uniref:hypothetical protein n=1 Tax=Streptomyces sp. NPDC087850 TaxID=3365809 RepID=UPI0037F757F1